MVQVFGNDENDAQTHVFIIGIGHYPYLTNGTLAVAQVKVGLSSLGQLTCPQRSAVEMYRTFESLHQNNNLALPLGSITLLISDFPDSNTVPPELQTEPATRDNIRTAYRSWRELCLKNKNNTAIFYFCGHGIEDDYHYLLTEEFGAEPDEPYEGAFNFDRTMQAFSQLDIKTQLFFVDACRDTTLGLIEDNVTIKALETSNKLKKECAHKLVIRAAAKNDGSYGEPDQATYFAKALINALTGAVSLSRPVNNQMRWTVETADLCTHIETMMELQKSGQGFPGRCPYENNQSARIAIFTTPPVMTLEVACDPDPALEHADLSCINVNKGFNKTRGPLAEKWKVPVPAGVYHVKAQFAQATYRDAENIEVIVNKPFTQEILSCL